MLWKTYPLLEFISKVWHKMAEDPKYIPVQEGINGGLNLIHKYTNLSEASDGNIVCLGTGTHKYMPKMLMTVLVLDPNIKVAYFKTWWAPERYKGAVKKIWKLVSNSIHSSLSDSDFCLVWSLLYSQNSANWDLSAIWTRAYVQFTLNYIYIYIYQVYQLCKKVMAPLGCRRQSVKHIPIL